MCLFYSCKEVNVKFLKKNTLIRVQLYIDKTAVFKMK